MKKALVSWYGALGVILAAGTLLLSLVERKN